MIYLELFWVYFKIGLFTIGGGYAMLPMIRSEVVAAKGWITEQGLIDFIAVAESTPGPFAVNLATFVGFETASSDFGGNIFMGILGSATATFAVVLPSLVIIIIVSVLFDKFIKSRVVSGFFAGVKPVVVGLVAGAAFTILLSTLVPDFSLSKLNFDAFSSFDLPCLILTAVMFVLANVKFKPKKAKASASAVASTSTSTESSTANPASASTLSESSSSGENNASTKSNASSSGSSASTESNVESSASSKAKTIHPILLIAIAAVVGVLLFGVLGL